ncbi:MAG: hypothetical protein FWG69_05290 [Oscillospiraceae bacterium]|nr:hypothetical protein [Oscillospiraceae bacterium]
MKRINLNSLLQNKKSAIVISVLLAIITWTIVVVLFVPEAEVEIRNIPITVSMTGTLAETLGLTVVEGMDDTVSITVGGKRAAIGGLTANDFTAVVSAAGVTGIGMFDLDCTVVPRTPNQYYSIVSDNIFPIRLKFDKKVSKIFNITAIAKNVKATKGFLRLEPFCMPTEVTVVGAQRDIDRIEKVVVETNESRTASETLQLSGTLKLYDINNSELDQNLYSFDHDKFDISVIIYKTKSVPVSVDFIHVPVGLNTEDFEYSLSHTEVEIAASADAVESITNILAGHIDVRKIDMGSSAFTFEIELPAGVISVKNIDEVTVTIRTRNLRSKSFEVNNLSVVNAPAGYEVDIVTAKLSNVKMIGKRKIIERLTTKDIVGVIDLMDQRISPGVTTVPILVRAPDMGLVWAVGEYDATISISESEDTANSG